MTQPPAPDDDHGPEPGRRDGRPGGQGQPGHPPGPGGRDPRLADFGPGEVWPGRPPGPELAAVLAAVCGPEGRYPGAEPGELIGVLRRWAALESWASAAKLGVLRELIRRDDLSFPGTPTDGSPTDGSPTDGGPTDGGLPSQWTDSLKHEVALALASSVQSADKVLWTARELETRLPGTGQRLADGTLTLPKAKLIAETFEGLSDENAARAEELLLPQLTGTTGKTYTQIERLAAAIATEVDPELAERQREAAERHRSRVEMFRERAGTAALSGRDLPTDETLAAYANVNARAGEYKDSGAFPDARMDQLRALAYLDLLNGITTDARVAHARATAQAQAGTDADARTREPDYDPDDDDDPGADEPGDGPTGGSGPGGGSPDDGDADPDPSQDPLDRPAVADVVIPLLTLLGLAERPGEGHGLGPLDPGLCRTLAATTANWPNSQWYLTVTDETGVAIGHGCAKVARPGRTHKETRTSRGRPPHDQRHGPPVRSLAALPARVNLTIPLSALETRRGPARPPAPWTFMPHGEPGPDGGYGTWVLTLPGGRDLTVALEPVPVHACDHRHESRGYQPNDTLRRLVQVRDGECTFPPCSRHARESDFEHAVPYDKGGRTCTCNAGARSRRCHRVKQSPGWNVTQPRPGWHQWTTPAGWTYTQGPKRYPA